MAWSDGRPRARIRASWREVALALLPVAIIALSVLVHVRTLNQPLLETYGFRQTQTAYTARVFHESGIDLLHSQMPVMGPPWEVPFELPLFQAAASLVMDVGVAEDRAMRLTGLATFVLSAGLLYLLARPRIGRLGANFALIAFVASPFALLFSRTSLIEYSAVAASLAFALAGLHWRERGGRAWYGLALVAGIVAMTVKVTTGVFWILPFALLGFTSDANARRDRRWIGAWALTLVPLAAALAWTAWADGIKAASPETAWLTSRALFSWNFGTLAQRLSPQAWSHALYPAFWPIGGIVLPLAVILVMVGAWRSRGRRFWTWMLIALVGPILVFFNLYVVHQYYSAAITPAVAMFLGAAAAFLFASRARWSKVALVGGIATIVVAWVALTGYWRPGFRKVADPHGVLPLARQISAETDPSQLVAIVGRDWSPEILYYARRRGLMVPTGVKADVGALQAAGYVVYRCPGKASPVACVRLGPGDQGLPPPTAVP